VIESPYDAVEASRCALDRMSDNRTGCSRTSEGCRWCEHPVRPLLKWVRDYIEDPKNNVAISNYERGKII
jgi:hypothetical protein